MATKVTIDNKDLTCLICGNDEFNEANVKQNSSALSWLDMDWANKGGTAYICTSCGFNHEFYK